MTVLYNVDVNTEFLLHVIAVLHDDDSVYLWHIIAVLRDGKVLQDLDAVSCLLHVLVVSLLLGEGSCSTMIRNIEKLRDYHPKVAAVSSTYAVLF